MIAHRRFPIPRGLIASLAALPWVVISVVPAVADITIKTTTNGVERTMYLTADKLCVTDETEIMLFDSENQVIRFVDTESKTVREMTQQDLAVIGAMAGGAQGDQAAEYEKMMEEARKQAMESIKDLPEDQRKMAEEEINKRLGGARPPTAAATTARTFKPMNTKKEINGYPCKGYSIMVGDATIGEVWTTSLEALEITQEDVAVIGKMRNFFASGLEGSPFMEEAMAEFTAYDPGSEGFIGFPVRQVDVEGGSKDITELVSIDRSPIAKSVFTVGSDYTKESMGE